jgi:predicted phosphodiesterase
MNARYRSKLVIKLISIFIFINQPLPMLAVGSSFPESSPRLVSGVGSNPGPRTSVQGVAGLPPENLKVAFIGDQGLGTNPTAVLQMIEDEGADLVIHMGDFDYVDDPDAWDQQINDVLGQNYPYFITIGNHDVSEWSGYQQKFQERLARIPDAQCSGDLGVKSSCVFQGLFIVLSGAGTLDSGHTEYIQQQLAQDGHLWKVCAWHKNQNKMQVGSKTDEVGWGPYEACRQAGAMVATGHEHSYSRTFLMSSFENQTIATQSSTLDLFEGLSFAFVSGLGGKSIRNQDENWPWMAAVYTSDQNANYGALFCTFYDQGQPNHASCVFKDIDGATPDQFQIFNHLWDEQTFIPLLIR